MTQPSIGPEQRVADFNSQQVAYQKNAEPTIQDIHRRLSAENVDLRGQLEMSRKATSAAQELLEAERTKNAALNDGLINAEDARAALGRAAVDLIERNKELRQALDTEKLLRVNDRAEMDDLQRRLREAEGQLKAQRDRMGAAHDSNIEWYRQRRTELAAENAALRQQLKAQRYSVSANVGSITGNVFHPWVAEAQKLQELTTENAELRRTISLMAKTAAEVQDNFRLIAELAADPADEKRKGNTPTSNPF